jgi:hypothetical protein
VNGKKLSNRWVYAALAITLISWALLAAFFGATDLQISRTIVNKNSAMEIFGRITARSQESQFSREL